MSKALHVVVHHRQDPSQPWANSWLDDERLEAITTTTEIGELCTQAMVRGEPVFVHRCGSGESQPLVCCTASVIESSAIDGSTSLVRFGAQKLLGVVPTIVPFPGQNYYWA